MVVIGSEYEAIRDNGFNDGYVTINTRFYLGYPKYNYITVPRADNHHYRYGDWPVYFRRIITGKLEIINRQLATCSIVRLGDKAVVSIVYNGFCIQKRLGVNSLLYGKLIRTLPNRELVKIFFNRDYSLFIDYTFFPRMIHNLLDPKTAFFWRNMELPKNEKDMPFLKRATRAPFISAFKIGLGGFDVPWMQDIHYIHPIKI